METATGERDLRIPAKFAVLFPSEAGGSYRKNAFSFYVCHSGRAGLKTWQIARALLLQGLYHVERVFCGRETLVSIKQSVLHELEEQINLLGLQHFYTVEKTTITGANGTEFLFGGLRVDPESLKSMGHITKTWIEEASGVSQRSLDVLLPTVLRTPGSEVWFSYNPEDDEDPVHKRFVAYKYDSTLQPDPDACVIESSWQDALAFGVLTPQMVAEKDKAYATDFDNAEHVWGGRTRRRNVAAIMADKCIVQEFTPGSDWLGPFYGADWGFSNDPALMRKHWVNNGCLFIEEEAYGIGIDIPELPTLFTQVTGWWRYEFDQQQRKFLSTKIPLPHVKILSDCSRPETISQMVKMGVPCVAAKKWPGCIEDGIAVLRGFTNIIIHPRCKQAIHEAKHYRYKMDKNGKVLPIIVDADNHGWDATRYAMEDMIVTGEQDVVTVYDSVRESNIEIAPELDAIDEQPYFYVMNGGLTF
jgi:phage terminase large subunit